MDGLQGCNAGPTYKETGHPPAVKNCVPS
jgi:hypothetical protein